MHFMIGFGIAVVCIAVFPRATLTLVAGAVILAVLAYVLVESSAHDNAVAHRMRAISPPVKITPNQDPNDPENDKEYQDILKKYLMPDPVR